MDRVDGFLWREMRREVGFLNDWAPIAKELEMKNYTQFTPHYLTWSCPLKYEDSDVCLSECINNGDTVFPDPDRDLDSGYSGADVVVRIYELFVLKSANDSHVPTRWWDTSRNFNHRAR